MQIITIIGARPQFIKAAAFSNAIKDYQNIEEIIIHTGQHYDDNMSKIFFEELNIPAPKYHLDIGSGHHGQQTGRMLESIEKILLDTKPDCVLVYGDTNSTLAGALAAIKLHIPIAHIEAGLRSFNQNMPEEINRILTDQISRMLFTPTATATNNLVKEGINKNRIFQVGDIMHDAAILFGTLANKKSIICNQLSLNANEYVLATIHRAENTDNTSRLANIFSILNEISSSYKVIFPIHPRTLKKINELHINQINKDTIIFIDPVGYLDMVALEKNAHFIITDSGGVQKEAFFYQRPCITLRDETEWTELVELGWNKVTSPNNKSSSTTTEINDFITNFNPIKQNPYGKGNCAQLIATIIPEILKK